MKARAMNNVTNLPPADDQSQKRARHVATGLRTDLIMGENFALMKFIEAEYAESGMTDKDFAAYSMTKLKFREGVVVKDHNIKMRRDQMGIPNNRKAAQAGDPMEYAATILAQEQKITDLEERLTLLEGWVNTTFPNRNGKKAI